MSRKLDGCGSALEKADGGGGILSLEDAQDAGFVIDEIPPTEEDIAIYGNAPRFANVSFQGKDLGTFTICHKRRNKDWSSRWLSNVPMEHGGSPGRRVQINLCDLREKI